MKFQKELKRYHSNLTEMLAATDSMFRVIKEMYEPTWIGYTEYVVATQHLPSSLEALHLNIIEHLITPFNLYMSQFPEIKAKINKRNRKLMDYDSARHHHDSLMSKKTQDTKSIQNVAKELEKTQKIYDDINAEVNKEMADFYNSRVFATATAFNALINADLTYFNDAGKKAGNNNRFANKIEFMLNSYSVHDILNIYLAKSMKRAMFTTTMSIH
ncbi:hypothetical protein HELRODRAFT_160395 [Helobdella robusta]|uniref:BAR domain-containing protein n=1 Tax=Helobdella robusta TaxID=6412 RepID=T1EQ72_HELRO|nr:hypothetical protein HELRODRAFT_160395 [Helobdella robusta]ESO06237.1 hypothetical protein HELRODRAFT_160395 [Helobdella robusta]